MGDSGPLLARFGQSVSRAGEDGLSPALRERVALHVLDTLGAWLFGRSQAEARALAGLGGGASGAIFGDGMTDQAGLRAATARMGELDDIHMASGTTPGSVVVMTALSLAAHLPQTDADTFVQAVVAGYRAMTRLGVAVGGAPILYRGVWPTYLLAPAGAAAVAARLLDLDAAAAGHAAALALGLANGRTGPPAGGVTSRWLLIALAVRDGCACAFAAAAGMTGDLALLDGPWSARVCGGPVDPSPIDNPLPAEAVIGGLSIKPFRGAKQLISAQEAFGQLLSAGLDPGDIAAIRIGAPAAYVPMIAGRTPGSIVSAPYNLAAAAYGFGGHGPAPADLDAAIEALMRRADVVADEDMSRRYPAQWPAKVDVTLSSGEVRSATVLDADGDPSRAWGVEAVSGKFMALATAAIGQEAADAMAAACLQSTRRADALSRLCAMVEAQAASGAAHG